MIDLLFCLFYMAVKHGGIGRQANLMSGPGRLQPFIGIGLSMKQFLMHPFAEHLRPAAGQRIASRWLPALRARRLPKRALEVTAADLGNRVVEDWVHSETPMKRGVEDSLAQELGLEPGEVVIDFPAKKTMFQLNLLIKRRGGQVERLGSGGLPGLIDLPRVAEELYTSTRVLRVFTFERRTLDRDSVLERITRST